MKMRCQFCGTVIRGSKYGCKKCKPKIVHANFEFFDSPSSPANQIAIVVSVNGKEYAGYLLRTVKSPEQEREEYGMKRVWEKCKHGMWLSPCPVCIEQRTKKSEIKSPEG